MQRKRLTHTATKRLAVRYLVLSGILAHAIFFALYLHFASTGATLHRYVSKGVAYLDRDSSPTRHVARFVQALILDTRLVVAPDSEFETLPDFPGPLDWPQTGPVSTGFTRIQFDDFGVPIQTPRGAFAAQASDRIVNVDNVSALIKALSKAQPGDVITLSPGRYRIKQRRLSLGRSGTARNPIVVRAQEFGSVRLELDSLEGFYVNRAYWVFENLMIRGTCGSHSRCEHAFHVVGNANGITIRNVEAVDFNAPVKVNGQFDSDGGRFPDHGLIHNSAFFNTSVRNTGNPVTLLNINAGNGWVVSSNFIADFAKGRSDKISYAAFMKSNSKNGLFERNLVVCHWRLPIDQGVRVGLSFGGGGSSARMSRGGSNATEHTSGVIRNNIIARCPKDVGIYLNKAPNTQIRNNLITDTIGIDVRFTTSSAEIRGNIFDGRIKDRDGGTYNATENLTTSDCSWHARFFDECGSGHWFANPRTGDYRLSPDTEITMEHSFTVEPELDFCGQQRDKPITTKGPFQYPISKPCLP